MKKIYLFLIVLLSLLLVAGSLTIVYWPATSSLSRHERDREVESSNEVKKISNTEPPNINFRCPLDNQDTTEEKSLRRPIAIMIENHPDARPQSGLSQACIVYETVAEGGITRFMAIFLHNDANPVGPVRSAREYYVDLAKQYNAIYVHCGGPSYIYGVIKGLNVSNIDEFSNSDAFWRIRERRAPHNLFTSTGNLRSKAAEKGYRTDVFFQKPNFKDDSPIEMRPVSASIDINFSKPAFAVHYDYDRQGNLYKRSMAGKPHIDATNGQQIAAKNVIIQYVPISNIANDPKGRMRLSLIGSGDAIVFQDGKAISATWMRPTLDDLTRYYDSTGAEIKLNRGQTWIELVDKQKMKVSYQ
ncbi:MAG: DUF3048 domain-containing protein [Actinomycetota bacterium]